MEYKNGIGKKLNCFVEMNAWQGHMFSLGRNEPISLKTELLITREFFDKESK